jgi:hypothetical protein
MAWKGERFRHKMASYGMISGNFNRGPLMSKEDAAGLSKSLSAVGKMLINGRSCGIKQYTDKELIALKKASKYFHLDKMSTPNMQNMMENPEYFETKKGKRWDIILMTPAEYENAIKKGFDYQERNNKNVEPYDIRERLDENNLKQLVKFMKTTQVTMPWIEYENYGWNGKKYVSFNQEGHHRVVAAEELGLDLIPVFMVYPNNAVDFYATEQIIPRHVLSKIRKPTLEAKGNNIKQIVNDPKWQKVRISMKGSWKNKTGANKENLKRLNVYLGEWKDARKLRQVHNYLGALRGVKDKDIVQMREKVKKIRGV